MDGASDLLRANIPVYTLLYDSLVSGGLPLWSWNMGIGTTIFSHADAMTDPFTYVSMIGGRENIAYMLVWVLILKIVLEGAAFSLYLRHFDINPAVIIIGSLMYAFSGYSLIMGSNLVLGTVLVFFPILLLCIEKMLDGKSIVYLLVILAIMGLYSYYYFFSSAIVSLLYLIVRCRMKHIAVVPQLVKLFFLCCLALLIVAPLLLPQLDMAFSSTRANSGMDVKWSLSLLIPDWADTLDRLLRSLNINIIGKYGHYQGDFFQNEWYVSALTLPLVFYCVFSRSKMDRKIAYTFLLLVLLCSLPIVSFAMNAFRTINYRWMYVIHFLLCVMSCFIMNQMVEKGIDKQRALASIVSSVVLVIILLVIYYAIHDRSLVEGLSENYLPIAFVITVMAIIALFTAFYDTANNHLLSIKTKTLSKKNIAFLSLVLIVAASLVVNFYPWFNGPMSHNYGGQYGYDEDYEVIEGIHSLDQGFYRIYKDYDSVYDGSGIPSDNDSKAQMYYGLKCYCSMNNPNYVTFLQTMGVYVACNPNIKVLRESGIDPSDIKGANLNYINGIDDKYDLLDYLGVKYYLSRSESGNEVPSQFEYLYTKDGVDVYHNTSYRPLAFVQSHYVSYDAFIDNDYLTRLDLLMHNTILNAKDMDVFNTYEPSVVELAYFSSQHLIFNATIGGESQYVSFSIPFDKGWAIYIDGEKVESKAINISLLGVKVPGGTHQIELRYSNDAFHLGLIISAVTLSITAVAAMGLLVYKQSKKKY